MDVIGQCYDFTASPQTQGLPTHTLHLNLGGSYEIGMSSKVSGIWWTSWSLQDTGQGLSDTHSYGILYVPEIRLVASWFPHSSGILRVVDWQFLTEVSGKLLGHVFKCQAIKEEDETERLSRNVANVTTQKRGDLIYTAAEAWNHIHVLAVGSGMQTQDGSTVHKQLFILCPFKKKKSPQWLNLWMCAQQSVLKKGITILGRYKVNLAVTTPCRLQLSTV